MLADPVPGSECCSTLFVPLNLLLDFCWIFFSSRTSSILKFSVDLMLSRSPNPNLDYQSSPKQNRIRFDVKLQVKAPPTWRPLPHTAPPT